MARRIFRKNWLYTAIWWAGRLVYRIVFRWELHHVDHLPADGPCIIASSHASFLDPQLIGTALDRPIEYMGRTTLFTGNRFLAWLIIKLGTFPIDLDGDARAAIRAFCARLAEGQCVLLFPEGTRTRDGRIGVLKAGVGMIATRASAPVLPIYLAGTFDAWPRHQKFPRPAKVRVCAGDLITPRDTGSDRAAAKAEQQRIHNEVERQLRSLEARYGPGGTDHPDPAPRPTAWRAAWALAACAAFVALLTLFFRADTAPAPTPQGRVEEALHMDGVFLWRVMLPREFPDYNAFLEISDLSRAGTLPTADSGTTVAAPDSRVWRELADFGVNSVLRDDGPDSPGFRKAPRSETEVPAWKREVWSFRIGMVIQPPRLSELGRIADLPEDERGAAYGSLSNEIRLFTQHDETSPVPGNTSTVQLDGVMLNIAWPMDGGPQFSRVRALPPHDRFMPGESRVLWQQDVTSDGVGWQIVRLRLGPAAAPSTETLSR